MRGSGMFSVGDGLGAIFEKLADNVCAARVAHGNVSVILHVMYVGASESSGGARVPRPPDAR